jgi:hypothetical protein
MRTCEADGCDVAVESPMLMCPAHWRRVPAALKRAVYATWNVRRTALGKPGYQEAVAAHEAAKRGARDAVAEGSASGTLARGAGGSSAGGAG